MGERRRYKNKNESQYREMQRDIIKLFRKPKEKLMKDLCRELEELQNQHDDFNIAKKIQEMTGQKNRVFQIKTLKTNENKLHTDQACTETEWMQNVYKLFHDERNNSYNKTCKYLVYICFIDYGKAFDRVKHAELIKLLYNQELDSRDILKSLYWMQSVSMTICGGITRDIPVKGVRHGWVISSLLFDLSEKVLQNALENSQEDIKVNGKLLTT